MAYLLTLAWCFWISPAGVYRRCGLIAFLILFGWLGIHKFTQLPYAYLGYGYLLGCFALLSRIVGLSGWDKEWRLVQSSTGRTNFSLRDLMLITAFVALLCVSAQAVWTMRDSLRFSIVTAGYAIIAALVQHGFTAESNNKKWIFMALSASALVLGALSAITIDEIKQAALQGLFFGGGGFFNSRYWYEGMFYGTQFLFFVSIVPAIAGWLKIVRRCETATLHRLSHHQSS